MFEVVYRIRRDKKNHTIIYQYLSITDFLKKKNNLFWNFLLQLQHLWFSRNFASLSPFLLNSFSRKNAKFCKKVCEIRTKMFAFFLKRENGLAHGRLLFPRSSNHLLFLRFKGILQEVSPQPKDLRLEKTLVKKLTYLMRILPITS